MKVFLSSTCYDLLDVRAEVVSHLSENGIRVMASDDKLSDFHVTTDQNSIETCLANVRSCDHFVIILDQRYGPILSDFGHNVSATHLEYQEAAKEGKHIHLFARDRLIADYSIWKKNGEQSIRFAWVKNEKDHLLFQMLKEHEMRRESESNWIETFISSIDLKRAVFKRFRNIVTPARLSELIAKNEFPILELAAESVDPIPGGVIFKRTLYNRGDSPAFNLQISYKDEVNKRMQLDKSECIRSPLTKSGSLQLNILCEYPLRDSIRTERIVLDDDEVKLDYDSIYGIRVSDKFKITLKYGTCIASFNSVLIDRVYSYCEPPRIEILEASP